MPFSTLKMKWFSRIRAHTRLPYTLGLALLCSPWQHARAADTTSRLITSSAIAVDTALHKVYAVDQEHDAVTMLDARTGQKTAIAVGKSPIALAVLSSLHRVFVVNTADDSISVIDGVAGRVVDTLKAGSHPYSIAADELRNKVYITHTYDHILTAIDGPTHKTTTLDTGSADGITIDEKTNKLFLYTYENADLRIVDANTGSMHKVQVGGHVWGMIFNAQASQVLLAHTATASVTMVDEKTEQTSRIPVGQIPCALALNPVTHKLYVVNYGDKTLSVIDAVEGKQIAVLPVGDHPQAVAVDTRANRVYVANVHDRSISALDGASNQLLRTIAIGQEPYALTVDENNGSVYAAIYGGDGLAAVLPGRMIQ